MGGGFRPIRRALLSLSDKRGLAELARFLALSKVGIIASGGTAKAIAEAGVPCVEVSNHTGFPEMLDGRVKTLHPKVHGGILARRDLAAHGAALAAHGIGEIDLVAVNLYPFEATVRSGATFDASIENIDIGGPALIRSAAKNADSVLVLTDPDDYDAAMAEMKSHGGATRLELRRRMAAKAFARTAAYDAAIAAWYADVQGEAWPKRMIFAGELQQVLRYGENPHQQAAFYRGGPPRPGVANARQIQGKELSYNNLNDADAALELAAEFDRPAVAIIKHANPCGVAMAEDQASAWERALACDPQSAYGGVVALNRPLDAAAAKAIASIFTEVIIAPGASDEARKILAAKRNLRLLLTEGMPDPRAEGLCVKSLAGGYLAQTRDNGRPAADAFKVVTKRQPTTAELGDLHFAFTVCKHVKSNAIVYAKGAATVGIGAGQMSRVDAARIARQKAEDAARAAGLGAPATQGSVAASDAFFPFADGLETVAAAGCTAVIQPGGSVRDDEVIAAADKAGLAMVFTGMRHFRH
jgi:phosphoribosylaminoimidazolecarboxamide formyltransferase / IMP cyclohydrolase